MNCPHGRADGERCDERGCAQRVFAHARRPGNWGVKRLLCDSCGRGVGRRRLAPNGGGLCARTIRDFNAQHANHDCYFKLIEVDGGTVLWGRGLAPLEFDSDEEIVNPTNPST